MRTTSMCLAAATVCSLAISSSAFGAGEIEGAFRRTNLDSTKDRIEFFLRNTQQGAFAGSNYITAVEVTLTSDKPMVVSNPLPTASQAGLRNVTTTTTLDSTIFEFGFPFGSGITSSSIQLTGFDASPPDPRGVLAVTANGGRGAGVISVIVAKDGVVTMSGQAGNEYFQGGGPFGGLEADIKFPFAPIVAVVPEPASFAVLGLGGLVALRRRSR